MLTSRCLDRVRYGTACRGTMYFLWKRRWMVRWLTSHGAKACMDLLSVLTIEPTVWSGIGRESHEPPLAWEVLWFDHWSDQKSRLSHVLASKNGIVSPPRVTFEGLSYAVLDEPRNNRDAGAFIAAPINDVDNHWAHKNKETRQYRFHFFVAYWQSTMFMARCE